MARRTHNGTPVWRWSGKAESTQPIYTTVFTPVQLRMLSVLSDGMPHLRTELHKCLWDEQSHISAIRDPISRIRKKIRPLGQDIVCEYVDRQICYRHIVLLPVPNPLVLSKA